MVDQETKVGVHGIWVDNALFNEFKKEVKTQRQRTLGEEFTMLIRKRLAELQGKITPEGLIEQDSKKVYERLSRQHFNLTVEKARVEKVLTDSGSYARFLKVLGVTNLEKCLSGGTVETPRFKETIQEVLEGGRKTGDMQGALTFIAYMKLIREQKTIEAQLNSVLSAPKPLGSAENPIVCEPEAKANGDTELQKEEAKLQETEEEVEDDLEPDEEEDDAE